MPQHDDLFELIRSLTPNEKRYVDLHAGKYGKSHYDKLYIALKEWPGDTYDEKQFKKRHKGKAFLKNLPYEKNYLKELLLRILRSYHSEADMDSSLLEMMLDIRLLIRKGLTTQALKLIERALKFAEEHEKLSEIFLLHDMLLDLGNMHMDTLVYRSEEIQTREKDFLDQMMTTRQTIHLRTSIVEIHRRMEWDKRSDEVKSIMFQVNALQKATNLSRRAEIGLVIIQQYYFINNHEYPKALKLTQQWLKKLEHTSQANLYSPDQYRTTLANCLLCMLKSEKFEEMPSVIEKIKGLKTTDDRSAADSFRLAAQYEIVYLLNKVDFAKSETIITHIEAGLKKHRSFISEKQAVHFRFNIALLSFLRKDYSSSLDHIATLSILSGRDERYLHITAMARAIELMSHMSMGNFVILDNAIRNLKRYFADRKLNDAFFEDLMQGYSSILKDGSIRPSSIERIKKLLSTIKVQPEWEQLKAIVLAWLSSSHESKIG
jgi:hypothetical protein